MQVLLSFIISLLGLLSIKKELIDITWVEKLTGDYSFAKQRSIDCDAWCYEWAGANTIIATAGQKDTIHCYTLMNTATHCSLHLTLTNNSCLPTIVLKSIRFQGDKTYQCKEGFIKIDRPLWKRKILKAEFDFIFNNDENEKKIFWKGKIYTKIK
ncbi:MAG: hypothetical protein ABIN67_18000 [Ferruginibacter sp.]